MSSKAFDSTPSGADPASPLKRRGLILGVGAAGVAGAAAVAIKALPVANTGLSTAAASAGTAATESGGYQLTAHVLRYYETTRI